MLQCTLAHFFRAHCRPGYLLVLLGVRFGMSLTFTRVTRCYVVAMLNTILVLSSIYHEKVG